MVVDRFNPGISFVYQPVSGAKLSFLSDLFAVRTESDFRAWLFEGKPADVDTFMQVPSFSSRRFRSGTRKKSGCGAPSGGDGKNI